MVGPKLHLWQRIRDFAIDDVDSELTFTTRLARENGWSVPYARRVVEEYKRFVFLAIAAEHEVTPSDEVDQAWHLHLVYTHSYWDELCGEILGRPLHHGPTRGGRLECKRYEENYRKTLASYEAHFGEKPSADIWPAAEIRFGDGFQHIRVNTARNWIMNKRAASRKSITVALGGLSLASLGAAGPLAATNIDGFLVMLLMIGGLIALIVLVSLALRGNKRGGSDASGCDGCSSCGSFLGCGSGDGGSGCAGSGCGGGGGGCGGGGGD